MGINHATLVPLDELLGAGRREAHPGARQRAELDKSAFLQLLVAQIRHQDPLNPADGTAFLTQLAQFSELEQMINISEHLEAIRAAVESLRGPETAPDSAEKAQTNQFLMEE